MDTSGKPVLQILEDYKAAVFAKNLESFVALYDDDVQVFDMWGTWEYRGIAAWRTMVAGWFDSLGDARDVVEFSDAEATVTQDLAVIHAFVKYQRANAEGDIVQWLDSRMTMVLKLTSDRWKVIHEHTSSPVAHETLKVMLQRG